MVGFPFDSLLHNTKYTKGLGLPLLAVEFTPETDLATQASIMANTAVLVSAHGAALTNVIFMRPNTSMLEIFPPKFFEPQSYTAMTPQLGIHHEHYRLTKYSDTNAGKSLARKYYGMGPTKCYNHKDCRFEHKILKIRPDVNVVKSFVQKAIQPFIKR